MYKCILMYLGLLDTVYKKSMNPNLMPVKLTMQHSLYRITDVILLQH